MAPPRDRVRLLTLYFGRAAVIMGCLLLVSGIAIASSVMTIAVGSLWLTAAEDDEEFKAACAKLSDRRRGGCGCGVAAIFGLNVTGIVFAALEAVWISALMIAITSERTFYCYVPSYSSGTYYITVGTSIDTWLGLLPGHAIASGIATIALHSLSLAFVSALTDRSASAPADERTALYVPADQGYGAQAGFAGPAAVYAPAGYGGGAGTYSGAPAYNVATYNGGAPASSSGVPTFSRPFVTAAAEPPPPEPPGKVGGADDADLPRV